MILITLKAFHGIWAFSYFICIASFYSSVFGLVLDSDSFKHSAIDFANAESTATKLNLQSIPTMLIDSCQYPTISSDSKWIAFQYGSHKIGAVKPDGSGFKILCDRCLNPQWLNASCVTYSLESKGIYVYDIYSDSSYKLTNQPGMRNSYNISPNKRWLVYYKNNPAITNHINGVDQDLWIMSCTTPFEGKVVMDSFGYESNPTWSHDGDSLFFRKGFQIYYATSFDSDTISYSIRKSNRRISLYDYSKTVNNIFPYCRNTEDLYLIDAVTLKPISMILSKPGKYYNLTLAPDISYMIFIYKEFYDDHYALYKLKLDDILK